MGCRSCFIWVDYGFPAFLNIWETEPPDIVLQLSAVQHKPDGAPEQTKSWLIVR